MVVYTAPSVSVEYKCEENILLLKWAKKPDTEVFKQAYNRLLHFATEEYPTSLFCVDMSECGSFDSDQEEWLAKEYYLKVYGGVQDTIYAAVIFSEAHFQAIISNYKALENEPFYYFLHLNYFTKTREAFNWLSGIKKGQDVSSLPNKYA
jgi:hypothetical protein